MPRKNLLLIPGPTPVPEESLRAQAAPMVNHRGPEFTAVLEECASGLKQLFATSGEVLPFPAAGTGGLESAIVNTLSPGDRVLSCSVGAFGDRFAKIARLFGLDVVSCGFEWGQAVDPAVVEQKLETHPGVKAVLVTHNETSTGVVNDVRSVAAAAHRHGALVLVDSISGLIAHPLPVDEWGLDVVVAGSQKAFMIPPGLTFVSVSPRAWEANAVAKLPRFYWDYKEMRDRKLTPYTPPVSLFYALQASLRAILGEGLDHVVERHTALASAFRAGALALGLKLLAPETNYSNSVTAMWAPEGTTVKALRGRLKTRYGVDAAGGQGKLDGQIFRIGHLGHVGWGDMVLALSSLEMALADLGVAVTPGAATAAAQQVLRNVPEEVSL